MLRGPYAKLLVRLATLRYYLLDESFERQSKYESEHQQCKDHVDVEGDFRTSEEGQVSRVPEEICTGCSYTDSNYPDVIHATTTIEIIIYKYTIRYDTIQ